MPKRLTREEVAYKWLYETPGVPDATARRWYRELATLGNKQDIRAMLCELDAAETPLALTIRRERLKARLLEAKFWQTHHTWTSKTDNRVEYLQAQLCTTKPSLAIRAPEGKPARKGK